MFLVTMNGPHLHNMYPGTVCPGSSDPFFSNLLYIMGNYFLDIQYNTDSLFRADASKYFFNVTKGDDVLALLRSSGILYV